jgi:hypothetical protein
LAQGAEGQGAVQRLWFLSQQAARPPDEQATLGERGAARAIALAAYAILFLDRFLTLLLILSGLNSKQRYRMR